MFKRSEKDHKFKGEKGCKQGHLLKEKNVGNISTY